MSSTKRLLVLALLLIAVLPAGCGDNLECITVSELGQRIESLEGERVCVRGRADFRFVPYHPMMRGGCIPGESPPIGGELELVDESVTDAPALAIADLQCQGGQCRVECQPFSPGCTSRGDEFFCEDIAAFQFVGTLQVVRTEDGLELLLEDIDLEESRRLVDGEWGPIPTGVFEYEFP